MSDEQDMRKMGGIWKKIPITYVTMWFGSLALAGIFPFAGYYSKDAILEAAFADGSGIAIYGFICTALAAFLTAFYSWRLLLMTFHGKPRFDQHVMDHVHESPLVMTGPLMVLAVGALVAGMLLHEAFIGPDWQQYWGLSIYNAPTNHVLAELDHVPLWAHSTPLILGLLGIAMAYWWYMFQPGIPVRMAARFPAVYRFLLNKWYFDELYDRIFVQPAFRLSSFLWQVGDAEIIDGMPNGVAALTADGSRQVVKLQTGSLALYAFVMLIGVVALVSVYLLFR
jgi:NADH-quinone oxidoreductase subunit L